MKKVKIFQYLLLPSLLILLLLLIVWITLYSLSFNMIKEEVEKNYSGEFSRALESIDNNMEEVDKTLQRTLTSHNLMKLRYIDDPYQEKNIAILLQTESNLADAGYANNFILDYFLFFFQGDMIISSGGIFPSHRFWQGAYSFSPFPERDELENTIYKNTPLRGITYKNYDLFPQNALPYLRSFTTDGEAAGVILVLCDLDYIKKLFAPLLKESGYLSIKDKEGNIIHSQGEIPDTNRRSSHIKTAAYTGWEFELQISDTNIYKGLRWMKMIQIFIFLIVIIFCLIILFFYGSRRGESLYHIYNELYNDGDELDRDLFSAIASRVDAISSNEKGHIFFLKQTVMRNLLMGIPMEDSELSELFSSIGNRPEGDFFSVLLFSFLSYDDNFITIINSYFDNEIWFYQIGIDQLALIVSGRKDQDQWLNDMTKKLKKIIDNNHHIINVSMGDSLEHINRISQSYKQALSVMEYQTFHPNERVILYRNLPQNPKSLYWPLSVEQDISNLILTCQSEELVKSLDDLYRKNEEQSSEIKQILLYSLKGTLLRVINQAFSEEKLRILYAHRIEEKVTSLDVIKEEVEILIEILRSKQYSRSEKTIRQIVDYIHQNYMLSDFGLNHIIEYFTISEFHFSREFKKIMGQTFNSYVEDLRMKKARKLLKANKESIKVIASLCGYSSLGSFGRAFKKRHKLTPSAFQNSMIVK